MSLFQAREWWSIKPDGDEETHHGNMSVANIDNSEDGTDKIVTGSFQGLIRIYFPRQPGFLVDDLMLEQNLEEPILQLAAGHFTKTVKGLSLAVLHPRKLVVYTVSAVRAANPGQGNETSYYDLKRAYQHQLDRTAYNFCFGNFGGGHANDYICVQSMDGQLQFLEQERLAFSRYLNNFLTPGPLCYVAKIDSFITATSCMEIQCYKYQVLSSSSGQKQMDEKAEDKTNNPILTSAKKVQVNWTLNLGEHALQILVARFSKSLAAYQEDILVLGEHSLFTLTVAGQIRLQKKLDYNPSCCHVYNVSQDKGNDTGGSNQNLLLANYQNALMVYKDTQLVWAARCNSSPVHIAVGTFGGIKGFVCMLNDKCQTVVAYMGTDPPMQGVNTADNKDLDYEAMDVEHRRLLKVIRQANAGATVEPKDVLILKTQVPSTLAGGRDTDIFDNEEECAKDDQGRFISVMTKLFVSYSGSEDVQNITISFLPPRAFFLQQKTILLPSLRGGNRTPLALNLRFRVSTKAVPSDMRVHVVAAYTTNSGEPRTAKTVIELPLCLAARVVVPLKNQQYMFTLDTNRDPPALTDLFVDVLNPAIAGNPDIKRTASNVMTLLYYGAGVDVTILVSKKSGRYRLQSGCFEALCLTSNKLVERLQDYFTTLDAKAEAPPAEQFSVSFKELLPLHDYFLIIDKHHACRNKIAELRKKLEDHAHQFRVIQKRLLVRFKDKNPTPLQQLDVLFNETYNKLLDLGADMKKSQDELSFSANQLACATQLMVLLIRFKYGLDEENFAVLTSYLSPIVADNLEQGWEECTDSAMTHLLRTVLAKNSRDSSTVAQPLKPLPDTNKFKRHIQIVCDRLHKGLRLVPLTPGKKGAAAITAATDGAGTNDKDLKEDNDKEPELEQDETQDNPQEGFTPPSSP